jgi:2-succinyl-6-hydroxy-2,4-cyclohexadiene-1-carboxylate synthase
MPNLSLNDLNYHYHRWGQGAPFLMLHGFTGSGATWAQLAEMVSGYTVIAPDLIGHGQTDAPNNPARYSIEQSAADLIELIAQLGLGKVRLLGYSMGARLALYTALHYPAQVEGLIMESGSPGLATEAERAQRRAQDETLAQRIEHEGVAAFVNHWENLPLFETQKRLPPEVQAAVRAGRLQNRAVGLAHSLRGMGTGAQPALWEELPQLNVPTTLITGVLDQKYDAIARAMVAALPAARHIVIPDAGHTPHLEQPGQFIHAIS